MAMKSCGPCGLKTGCFLVALYTLILGILLAGFNGHDLHYYGSYQSWSRITSIIFAVALIFAGICLFLGLRKNSNSLLGTWFIIFLVYVVVQIAYIVYSIVNYISYYDGIPNQLRPSVLGNIIVFAVLITVDIICLMAVRSYRTGSAGGLSIA